jgi:aldose 1-epimerase
MNPRIFGTLPSGVPVEAHTLANAAGVSAVILSYGCIVASLRVPDRDGKSADVVLGFDHLDGYRGKDHPYFGAITGRIAGRVTSGRLQIDGEEVTLPLNDTTNHLHGGFVGLDQRLWLAIPLSSASLRLTYHSPDGEEGYPGNLNISVTYTLTESNAFVVETEVVADCATPVCLTQHSYFNLAGEQSGSTAGHTLRIEACSFVPTDETLRLLDERTTVTARNDFRKARRLGDAIPELFLAHGDHYLFSNERNTDVPVAVLADPDSGRILTVSTDEAGIQLYTGMALDSSLVGKAGRSYGPHAGICLECQGYPNATTVDGFGDILVRPGLPQRRTTTYQFSTFPN